MIRFKEFLVETDTKSAYDMERVIVAAAGGPKFISKRIPNSEEVGKKVIDSLGLDGTGRFPKNIYPASARWNRHFPSGAKGSTLTPKTDFIIGNKRISLKTGNAQLMGGGINEATATFSVATENSGTELDTAVSLMEEHISNLLPATDLTKLGVKGNKTDLIQRGAFEDVEVLRKADEAHHAFKNDMRKLFQNNRRFAEEFVFEAMTGMVKFGNSEGTADHFLITDFKGNAKMHVVRNASDSYVGKIATQVKPDVKFKSTQKIAASHKSIENPKGGTGYYTFWSAVGIGINMIVKESLEGSDVLSEGWLRNIISKVKRFIAKIKSYIGDSWQRLLEFATITPVVTFKNNVSW